MSPSTATLDQPTDDLTVEEGSTSGIFDTMRGTRDAMSVQRVYGDPVTLEGLTVIPAARVKGGAGGGGGEGQSEDDEGGKGFGTGFGLDITPIGVYEVKEGSVQWRPTVDVNRVVKASQVLIGIIAVCLTLVLRRRS